MRAVRVIAGRGIRERQRRNEGMGKGAGVWRGGGVTESEKGKERVPAREGEREGKREWVMGETWSEVGVVGVRRRGGVERNRGAVRRR